MHKFIIVVSTLLVLVPKAFALEWSLTPPIVEGDHITLEASLSGVTSSNCPENTCYLQVGLQSQGGKPWFGELEKESGTWLTYRTTTSLTPELIRQEFYPLDIIDRSWSGILKIRYDSNDPSYSGPGPYLLRLFRYTGNSTSSTSELATTSAYLTQAIPTPNPAPTQEPTPTPTSTPIHHSVTLLQQSPSLEPAPSPRPIEIKLAELNTPKLIETEQDSSSSATVAGIMDSQAEPQSLHTFFLATGLGLLTLAFGVYHYFSKASKA